MKVYTVGDRYKNFEVTKSTEISELKCQLTELTHIPTGAVVMHLANDDPENLFCLSFQTRPDSSNGVAHILEHTVLCGSEKFPVKDPFFAMTRRSLNTFMNALTGQDFTCYPAASQVSKDFYNLLEVYLDAVFFPHLRELSFMQEGHRLEFTEPSNSDSPLLYKGIVYNEMKGAMSSHNSRLHESLFSVLFPDITYGKNSGGDPKEIPSLTYQGLLDFHHEYYHPSRCLFFFYGDLPLEEKLDFLAVHTLDKTTPLPPLPPMPKQVRFNAPKRVEASYPISEEEKEQAQTYISFAWLTASVLDQEELLALCIIEIVLMDTDASPLKMAFLKSGLCTQATAYIDPEISEAPVVITLRGCDPSSADALQEIMNSTLRAVVKNGIPKNLIDNAMHQLELHRCEITGDQSPFGLTLFMRSGLLKQHGAHAEDGLKIHSFFERLRDKIEKDPSYYTDLIKKYFLNNPHFVVHVMRPDTTLGLKENEEEQKRLEAVRKELSEEQIATIIRKAEELATLQKEQEEADIDVLPKVTLADVPKECRDYSLERSKAGTLEVFYHDTFTNNILYTDLVWELPALDHEELWLVRFFTLLIGQLGCGGRTYVETLDYIQAHTGGIGAGLDFNLQADNHLVYRPTLHIKSKALYRKADRLFPLLYDVATSTDFTDAPRIKEIVMKHYTGLVSSLNQHALKYALGIAQSGLNSAAALSNAWYGIEYFQKIKDLVQNYESKEQWLIDKLKQLKDKITCLDHPHLVLTCDREMYDILKKEHFYGLDTLPTKESFPWKEPIQAQSVLSQGRIIASPVAFTGKALETVSYTHPDAPALTVAANLLDNCFLHRLVREQGGAYGGGASSNTLSGSFTFYAYRDPNIVNTLAAFQEAIDGILAGEFDDQDIEEAKLEKIQGLDSPLSPGSRGDIAYEWWKQNRERACRQAFRERLLAVDKEEIIRVIREHVAPKLPASATVVFAGKELLEMENAKLLANGNSPLIMESV